MEEVDYNKILEELIEARKSRVTSIRPSGVGSLISGGSQGIEPIILDYASLYPSTMTMRFPSKNSIRKRKIRNIFPDIE